MLIEGTGERRLDTREGLLILLGYSVDEELDVAPLSLDLYRIPVERFASNASRLLAAAGS